MENLPLIKALDKPMIRRARCTCTNITNGTQCNNLATYIVHRTSLNPDYDIETEYACWLHTKRFKLNKLLKIQSGGVFHAK